MIEDDESGRKSSQPRPAPVQGGNDDVQTAAYETAAEPATGPPADLAAIFERHHGAVYRAAYRITGNAMDAEDVLQTVFTRLLRRPGSRDETGSHERLDLSQSAGSYLHRAAVNAALDLLRSRRRSRLVALGEVEQELVDEEGPGPERRSSGRELGRRLRTAMSRLSPRQAEIFALRYLEGMGNLEIARQLGSSQTAIAVILHRARHRLQRELQAPQGDRS
ncbi:MAG TPA: sigma-70 family RNA polymerase sigma factor [Thermoanaerobaculia bacterium]|jgi:RNA polymerase sigma-70 factor (ECF subfamily)|nr:sigma-70 family RNA polymerase sigma factor [Thermoanaerobaculia bacterium]